MGGLTQVVKTLEMQKKKYGRNSWGVTVIQIDINRWVHAFDRKFAR